MSALLRIVAAIAGAILLAWLILLAVAIACRGLLGLADGLWPDARPQKVVLVTRADWPVCVMLKPPPLRPRKGFDLYPRRDETT